MTTILIEKNVMVPMRDGVQLATDIYRLEDVPPTPVPVVRTPYNKDGLAGALLTLSSGLYVLYRERRERPVNVDKNGSTQVKSLERNAH